MGHCGVASWRQTLVFSDVASWTLTFRLVSSAAEHNEDDGEYDDDAATDAGYNDDD